MFFPRGLKVDHAQYARMVMSQKDGQVDGRARRTDASTSCSRVSSCAAMRSPTRSSSVRTRSAAVGSGRSSTVSRSAESASLASAWIPIAGWLDSSLPRSASIWTTRPRGLNVW